MTAFGTFDSESTDSPTTDAAARTLDESTAARGVRSRPDLRDVDGHASWRDVYAACGVSPSIEPEPSDPTSTPATIAPDSEVIR
jgi:hypothetical protein